MEPGNLSLLIFQAIQLPMLKFFWLLFMLFLVFFCLRELVSTYHVLSFNQHKLRLIAKNNLFQMLVMS